MVIHRDMKITAKNTILHKEKMFYIKKDWFYLLPWISKLTVIGARTLSYVAWAAFSLSVGRWTWELKGHSEALLMRMASDDVTAQAVQVYQWDDSVSHGGFICHRMGVRNPIFSCITHALSLSLSQVFLGCQLPEETLFFFWSINSF